MTRSTFSSRDTIFSENQIEMKVKVNEGTLRNEKKKV